MAPKKKTAKQPAPGPARGGGSSGGGAVTRAKTAATGAAGAGAEPTSPPPASGSASGGNNGTPPPTTPDAGMLPPSASTPGPVPATPSSAAGAATDVSFVGSSQSAAPSALSLLSAAGVAVGRGGVTGAAAIFSPAPATHFSQSAMRRMPAARAAEVLGTRSRGLDATGTIEYEALDAVDLVGYTPRTLSGFLGARLNIDEVSETAVALALSRETERLEGAWKGLTAKWLEVTTNHPIGLGVYRLDPIGVLEFFVVAEQTVAGISFNGYKPADILYLWWKHAAREPAHVNLLRWDQARQGARDDGGPVAIHYVVWQFLVGTVINGSVSMVTDIKLKMDALVAQVGAFAYQDLEHLSDFFRTVMTPYHLLCTWCGYPVDAAQIAGLLARLPKSIMAHPLTKNCALSLTAWSWAIDRIRDAGGPAGSAMAAAAVAEEQGQVAAAFSPTSAAGEVAQGGQRGHGQRGRGAGRAGRGNKNYRGGHRHQAHQGGQQHGQGGGQASREGGAGAGFLDAKQLFNAARAFAKEQGREDEWFNHLRKTKERVFGDGAAAGAAAYHARQGRGGGGGGGNTPGFVGAVLPDSGSPVTGTSDPQAADASAAPPAAAASGESITVAKVACPGELPSSDSGLTMCYVSIKGRDGNERSRQQALVDTGAAVELIVSEALALLLGLEVQPDDTRIQLADSGMSRVKVGSTTVKVVFAAGGAEHEVKALVWASCVFPVIVGNKLLRAAGIDVLASGSLRYASRPDLFIPTFGTGKMVQSTPVYLVTTTPLSRTALERQVDVCCSSPGTGLGGWAVVPLGNTDVGGMIGVGGMVRVGAKHPNVDVPAGTAIATLEPRTIDTEHDRHFDPPAWAMTEELSEDPSDLGLCASTQQLWQDSDPRAGVTAALAAEVVPLSVMTDDELTAALATDVGQRPSPFAVSVALAEGAQRRDVVIDVPGGDSGGETVTVELPRDAPKDFVEELRGIDVWATASKPFGRFNGPPVSIDYSGKPVQQAIRRCNPAVQASIEDHVAEWLRQGIIEPSTSAFNSNVHLVRQNGKERLVVDLKAVNAQVLAQDTSAADMEARFSRLKGMRFFSTFDVSKAFLSMELDEASRHITAFSTPGGRDKYQFKRLCFGFVGSPSAWRAAIQPIIRRVEKKFRDQGVIVAIDLYVDDGLISTADLKTHYAVVLEVMRALAEAGLRVSPNKCTFVATRARFLGYEVDENGRRLMPGRAEALGALNPPTTWSELRSMVATFAAYRHLVVGFADLVQPLLDLLREGGASAAAKAHAGGGAGPRKQPPAFRTRWEPVHDTAFRAVRAALTNSVELAHPDFARQFYIATDCSDRAWGAVLYQLDPETSDKRVIAVASGSLDDTQRRYSATDRECLAVIKGVTRFRHFFEDTIHVATDHSALTYLASVKPATPRLFRWSMYLASFKIFVTHIKGVDNHLADMLSRPPAATGLGGTEADMVAAVQSATRFSRVQRAAQWHRLRFDESLDQTVQVLAAWSADELAEAAEAWQDGGAAETGGTPAAGGHAATAPSRTHTSLPTRTTGAHKRLAAFDQDEQELDIPEAPLRLAERDETPLAGDLDGVAELLDEFVASPVAAMQVDSEAEPNILDFGSVTDADGRRRSGRAARAEYLHRRQTATAPPAAASSGSDAPPTPRGTHSSALEQRLGDEADEAVADYEAIAPAALRPAARAAERPAARPSADTTTARPPPTWPFLLQRQRAAPADQPKRNVAQEVRDMQIKDMYCQKLAWVCIKYGKGGDARQLERWQHAIGSGEDGGGQVRAAVSAMLESDKVDLATTFRVAQSGQLVRGLADTLGAHALVVPPALISDVATYMHLLGHQGPAATWARTRRQFWGPGLYAAVVRACQMCDTCQYRNIRPKQSNVPSGHISSGNFNHYVQIDFLSIPVDTAPKEHLLVMVDSFTRFTRLAVTTNETAAAAADALHRKWLAIFGPPTILVSDNGSAFISKDMRTFCNHYGIQQQFTSARNPRGNSLCERTNRVLLDFLCKVKRGTSGSSVPYLAAAQMVLNSRHLAALGGLSPMEAVTGTLLAVPAVPDGQPQPDLGARLDRLRDMRDQLRRIEAQRLDDLQRIQHVRLLDRVKYAPGDLVLKRLMDVHDKTKYAYDGPYSVLGSANPDATVYKIQKGTLDGNGAWAPSARKDATTKAHVRILKPFRSAHDSQGKPTAKRRADDATRTSVFDRVQSAASSGASAGGTNIDNTPDDEPVARGQSGISAAAGQTRPAKSAKDRCEFPGTAPVVGRDGLATETAGREGAARRGAAVSGRPPLKIPQRLSGRVSDESAGSADEC